MEKTFSTYIDIEVPFHDVDSMHVVWHGHYSKYLELARCRLLESFDYSYAQMRESGYAWPVVDMRLKYVAPAVFGQFIRVDATLVEWEYRLRIDYLIRDRDSGARLTRAQTTQVAVDMASGQMCYESPPVLRQRLGYAQ
ncbi:MAG: 4-hydroxybenzoyl-CoA thioesterase [Halioglobus sp.]|nr:4-hydroxybenzoyl-CoA thioesterase [Halioglobus sp.]